LDLRGLRVDSFQCRNHPDREGVGICVACRLVFCVECSTKIDGVNHCRECLAKRQRTAQASSKKRSGVLLRLVELSVSGSVVVASVLLVFGLLVLVGEANAKSGGRVGNRERAAAVARALRAYKRDTGAFPTAADGLTALVKRPEGAAGWQGPYVEPSLADAHGVPVDAFATPFAYLPPRTGETACILASHGANRRLETDLATVERLKVSSSDEGCAEGDDVVLFVD